MKMKACSVITKMWNTAQRKCSGNCYTPISAIRMKISSPAYMLPNSRSDNDSGLARNDDDLEHEVERDDERRREQPDALRRRRDRMHRELFAEADRRP